MVQLCDYCGGGGTGDPPVTCTMVEGDPCAACSESRAIYLQIRQLEEDIATLKAKRRVLATTINANHDPFIHRLPPEIGSHIFRLCTPSLNSPIWDPCMPRIETWNFRSLIKGWNMPLKLGAVCRKWRQLAWATPNLWVAPLLKINSWTPLSLVKLLPDLLREWLGRSGLLPLTIFFHHTGYSEIPADTSFAYPLKLAEETRVETLKTATDLVIEVIDLYWGRFEKLHLNLVADVHERISGSTQPNKITSLELAINGDRSPTQKFITESKPNPKYLSLINIPPTSIDIGWDNVTHAALSELYFEESVEVLQRAPALECCHISGIPYQCWDDPTIDLDTVILHPRLRSLNTNYNTESLFYVINAPSLEEWTHDLSDIQNDCPDLISLLETSNCFLKVLKLKGNLPDDLCDLLQATPFLERLYLPFSWPTCTAKLDDMFTRMSGTTLDSDVSSVEGAALGSFLPHLRFLECRASPNPTIYSFTWDLIPHLYHQGHRWSLTLDFWVHESVISDETALQLLQLVEEGADLRICEVDTKRDLLKKFRKRMREENR
jgi:hypothetical protein